MSEGDEGLLRRWSRRKQAAKAAPPAVAEQPDVPAAAPELPPLDSLGGASDYTAFLQKGVSAEIQRLALQRAWRSDASIAGFRGMAEYAWDFNTPEYGRLWAADDVAKLVQAVIAPPADDPPAVEHAAPAELPEAVALQPEEHEAVEQAPSTVAEIEPAPKEAVVRRHGSALPC